MRILMLTAQYLPETFGGAEQQCQKISNELAARGHQVTVFTSRWSFKLPYSQMEGNVRVIRPWTGAAPQRMGKYILSSVIWLIYSLIWFARHHREYDVIHIHQAKFQAFVGALWALWFKKPAIAKVGNSDSAFDLDSLKRKKIIGGILYRITRKGVTRFIAISSKINDEFHRHGIREQLLTIPNGVFQNYSLNEIYDMKTSYRKRFLGAAEEENEIWFLSAGRLSEEKNLPLLLNAFAPVSKEFANAKLMILGDGPLRKKLENIINDLGIGNSVVMKGYVKNVQDHMIAADFFVLPSVLEGMSNSLLEAMSTGLVPIGTKISGSEDLISNGMNGYLVDKPWPENLESTLREACMLSAAQFLTLQLESYSTIQAKYKMEVVTDRYEQLYKELLNK